MDRRGFRHGRLSANRAGASEVLQSLACVAIVLVCAGLVLAAVQAASSSAADRAARARAALQGDIVLDAVPRDPAVAGSDGSVNWTKAEAVAGGSTSLGFVPASVRAVSLRPAAAGNELFLVGSRSALTPQLVFASHPVALEMADGTTVPGVLTVGVAVE